MQPGALNALSQDACKVSLEMEFEFSNGLMDFAMEKLFSSSANSLVESLVKRAQLVYGGVRKVRSNYLVE